MKQKPALIFSLCFVASLISCGSNSSNTEDYIAEENYISSGLIVNDFDESGAARTALKCLNRQDLLSKFEVFVGHSNNFSNLIPENYLQIHGNASFCVVKRIYDNFGNVSSEALSFIIENFDSEKYSYSLNSSQNLDTIIFSFSTNIEVDFADLDIDSGKLCFVLSLINSDGKIISDFDASYGIDNCANIYFEKYNDQMNFSLNK